MVEYSKMLNNVFCIIGQEFSLEFHEETIIIFIIINKLTNIYYPK